MFFVGGGGGVGFGGMGPLLGLGLIVVAVIVAVLLLRALVEAVTGAFRRWRSRRGGGRRAR